MTEAVFSTAFDPLLATTARVADLESREGQAQMYLWLADVFAAAPNLRAVVDYRFGAAADWLNVITRIDSVGQGAVQMRRDLARPLDDAAMTSRLATSHVRLFSGLGGARTVSPCESAWAQQTGVSEVGMAALLVAQGVRLARAPAMPVDHLSVELTLMAHLVATGDSGAAAFHQRLGRWVPGFCRRCVARDHTEFWAGAALILASLLDAGLPAAAVERPGRRMICR